MNACSGSACDTYEQAEKDGIPIINRIEDIAPILDVEKPRTTFSVYNDADSTRLEELKFYFVTANRHCIHLSSENCSFILKSLMSTLEFLSNNQPRDAVGFLGNIAKSVLSGAKIIDPLKVHLIFPNSISKPTNHEIHEKITKYSYQGEISGLNFFKNHDVTSFKRYCDYVGEILKFLSMDHPRAALRTIRALMLNIAEDHDFSGEVVFNGEKIDTTD
jgi:hypothetical protein